MLKKLFLIAIVLAVMISWLGGIFAISFSPFFIAIHQSEKDFLKRVVRKIESVVYREATIHNPPGDVLPDQMDDSLKKEIKEKIN